MRVGVDVGTVRVGVARSDPDGLLAVPVETLERRGDAAPVVARVLELAGRLQAIELVVGLPIALSGRDTASTADARAVAALLAEGPVPVRLVDERLTTVTAQGVLRSSGRDTRRGRPVIDQVAAVLLLQHALDVERARGAAPGVALEPKRE